jgi:hypothetical protein
MASVLIAKGNLNKLTNDSPLTNKKMDWIRWIIMDVTILLVECYIFAYIFENKMQDNEL